MSLTKGFYHDDSTLGPEEPRIEVIRTALSNGVTLLNTADFYGPYDNHKLIGKPTVEIDSAPVEASGDQRQETLTAKVWLRFILTYTLIDEQQCCLLQLKQFKVSQENKW